MARESLAGLIGAAQQRLSNLAQRAAIREQPSQQGESADLLELAIAEVSTLLADLQACAIELPPPNQAQLKTNHQQPESVLHESQENFRVLTTHVPVGIFQTNSQGECVFVNHKWLELTGLSQEQAMGQGWTEALHPSDRQTVLQQWHNTAQTGHEFSMEYRFQTPDGRVNWVVGKATALHNKAGAIMGYLGTVTDITNQKQTEIAILELSTALENAVEGISWLDTQGKYCTVNKAYAKMVGYSQAEMIGMPWQVTIYPEDLAKMQAAYQHMLQDDKVEVETRGVRKDGSLFYKRLVMITAYDEQERFKGHYCFMKDISEAKHNEVVRKQAEEAVQEQEKFLRAIGDNIPNGYLYQVVREPDGRYHYTYISAGVERVTGLKPEAILADFSLVSNLRVQESRLEVSQKAEESAQNLSVFDVQIQERLPNGEVRWARACSTPRQIKDGRVVWDGIRLDINDLKQTEAALRQSEAKNRAMLAAIPDLLLRVKRDGSCLDFFPPTTAEAGTYRSINSHISEILPPDLLQQQLQRMEQAMATGELQVWEHQLPKGDKLCDEEIRLIPCGEDEVLVIVRDISERKQAEEALRKSEQRLQAILDNSPAVIYVIDPQNKILLVNRRYVERLSLAVEDVLGKSLYDIWSPEIADTFVANNQQVLETRHLIQIEETVPQPDGLHTYITVKFPLQDDAGIPYAVCGISTDITEKKQLEEQFYRAQRMESLGTLASGIAHDLNNMLTPILAIAQLLLSKSQNLDARSQEMLQLLVDSTKRGANLVKQVLTFARGSDSDRISLQLGHALLEVIKIIQQTLPKSIEIRHDIPIEQLWLISADSTQIHQVFMNICINTRDAMPEGGTLTLAAENCFVDSAYAQMNLEAQEGHYVVVSITDTGTGIPPNLLNRIFDPFFTTKEPGKGTGLGLSTVLGIVKNHAGFIQVYSEVGRGTQFRVYLPAIAETTVEAIAPEKLPYGDGELVLIVDDEAIVQQAAKALLENYHYKTLIASDGIEALALYAEHKQEISVVLIDMMMPNMDGFTTIRTLQRMNPQVKMIAASGLSSNRQQALAMGAQIFLSKPYTTEDLLNALHNLASQAAEYPSN